MLLPDRICSSLLAGYNLIYCKHPANDAVANYRLRKEIQMPHNVRVMCLSNDLDIIREMEKINVEEGGIRHMQPKARHYLVKLQGVRRPIVHILKEAFLANGGDAAVGRDVITAKVAESDVLLMGTRKQFDRVLVTLLEQGFGCKELSVEIRGAIKHFDSAAELPAPPAHLDQRVASMFEAIGTRTLVMGVLNVTPDSFSDGGDFVEPQAAVEHAIEMIEAGADMIDIGGESTRPGSEPLPAEEEKRRILPVIKELSNALNVPISVDTYKAEVAEAALDSGAVIVNDISAATFDPQMPHVIARMRCPAIIMHIKGVPGSMQANPHYDDLMSEIAHFLRSRVRALVEAGIDERMLIIDPGIGFGKSVEHNLEILRRLRELKSIGRPILLGTSRKSTIGKVLGDLPPSDRIEGTGATVAIGIANGADIVRVHDVKEMARTARMADAIVRRP